MVILQFNKLIRNKWVWGVFAVAISFFFAFDFLLADLGSDGRREAGPTAGMLAGKSVTAERFSIVAEDIRGIGRNRDWRRPSGEVNRAAWETLAALEVAGANGLAVTDDEVREVIRSDRSFAGPDGGFSFELYERLLRENSVAPERFEEFLKRRLTVERVIGAVADGSAWVSPAEVDRAVADMTDTLTVKVAGFTFAKEDEDKVELDDAGLRKWYDENVKSLALPERIKLRLVAFDATDKAVQAKMSVSENEMRDYYDANVDKYTTKGTNEVEVTKKFEEVQGEIEQELRRIAAVEFFTTNLNRRVYGVAAAAGASRLDEIAKEDGLTVRTSDWFALDGGFQEGFMKGASAICPGAQEFASTVAELDSESPDLRYGVITSDRTVWLVEKAETSPAHTPDFDEAKAAIRPRALRQAKADAFKAQVEAVRAKGAAAVTAEKNVSTNYTFAVCDLKPGDIPDYQAVAGAARKLRKGEVSEVVRMGMNRALLVVCEDRADGDAAKVALFRDQVREQLQFFQRRQLPEAWQKWNLERLGFETSELSSVAEAEAEVE